MPRRLPVGELVRGPRFQDQVQITDAALDYLKYDNCFNQGQEGNSLITFNRYKAMSDALNQTGRPILYSMCNWGTDYPWNWAQTIVCLWLPSLTHLSDVD